MTIKPFLTEEEIKELQQAEARSDKTQKRTPEQIQAIYSHGQNILISASAGSGKTFVMIERIFDMLARGFEVKQLFISTFTVKAANELKERLEKKLQTAISQAQTVAERQHLAEQINQLSLADIGTMDAFTNKLVSQYGYLLGLSPRFRMMEDNEKILLQQEVFQDLFADYMTGSKGQVFRQLVTNFAGGRKDSKTFQELVYAIYDFSQTTANPRGWLRDKFLIGYQHFCQQDNFPAEAVTDFLDCVNRTAAAIRDLIDLPDYKQVTKTGKPTADYQKKLAQIEQLEQVVTDWQIGQERELASAIAKLSQVLPAGDEVTVAGLKYPVYKEIQSYIKQWRHLEVIFAYQTEAAPLLDLLQAFMLDFTDQFLQAKIQENAFDFSDISHFAIAILEKHEQVRQTLQDRYQEVMVDEYQDNNHLQERLLELLTNGHNRFMVGDIKQSIYRFRQSDPQIFKERFDAFQQHPEQGQLILLKENFRSQSTVLNSTNAVFRHLMDEQVGDIRYDQLHQLVTGSQQQVCQEQTYQTQVLLYDEQADMDSQEEEILSVGEIDLVARELIQLHRAGVSFDQMCLLVSSRSSNDLIVSTLESYGIPVVVDKAGKNYLQSIEVMVVLDTLRTINNPLQDYPLVALLRSPMFAFDEDQLARVAVQFEEKIPFYDKLQLAVTQTGQADQVIGQTLREKIQRFLTCLETWRDLAKVSSLYQLIWRIYQDRFYYDYVGAQPNAQQAQANLYTLASRAQGFEQGGFKGLTRFIKMIDKLLAHDHDLANVDLPVASNAVNLMTIHKSKGLEFDYVFILNLNKAFNKKDSSKPYALSRDWGIGIQYLADMKDKVETTLPSLTVKMDTIAYQQIKQENQLAELSERMRLLYVAMTRAKKKLYLVGKASQDKFNSMEKGATTGTGVLSASLRVASKSFQDWLFGLWATFPLAEFELTLDFVTSADLTREQIGRIEPVPVTSNEILEQTDLAVIEQALRDLEQAQTYNQRHQVGIGLASVRTPSQVKEFYQPVSETDGIEVMEQTYPVPDFDLPTFGKKQALSPAAIGSATHELMQRLIISQEVTLADLQLSLEKVQADSQVKQAINLDKLFQFFQTDLGRLIQQYHDKLYREAPFAMLQEDEASGESYVIRGILDGYLILDDRIVLFDYKTDRFKDSKIIAHRYYSQMALYAQALSRSYQIDKVDKYLILLGGERLEIIGL